MELDLHIAVPRTDRAPKQPAATVKKAAELWRAGSVKEAAELLNGLFNEGLPDPSLFAPYVKELGEEYRDLVGKLYLVRVGDKDDDWADALFEFEEAGGGGRFGELAARFVGEKWEEVRECFYDKCPECMFLGDAEEPYSLKVRSPGCIECIPADGSDLHELSSPAEDYAHAMDGYSQLEGWALVRDDPEAKQPRYPAAIRTILKKIEARKLKYFPNVIFPLVEGKDLLDSCRQMLELLQLLDHGYRFMPISRYITDHPDTFPDLQEKRLEMLLGLDDDDDSDDDDLDAEESGDDLKLLLDLDDDDAPNDDDDPPPRKGRKKGRIS